MRLTAQNIKFILQLTKKHNLKGPVLTLGNQDIYATENELKNWICKAGLPLRVPSIVYYSQSQDLSKINPEAVKYIHARTFFEFIGIKPEEYYDIDKFPFDKPVIVHDLQKPIDEKYYNLFDFVLDSGTIEHIFDMKSLMSNIVYFTKVGGFVLHFTPAHNFLNHGFYQFSPTFFYDFYKANGFEIVESYIIEIRGNIHRFYNYRQEKDYTGLFFDSGNRLGNCFLVKKVVDVKKVVSPDQYYYKVLSENPNRLHNDFRNSFIDKMVLAFRRLIPIKYHGIFFKAWVFLKHCSAHKNFFDLKA